MFSDNNNYMKRIDEIEQEMHRLNERIPLVLKPLTDVGDRREWKKKINHCLVFFEKNSQNLKGDQRKRLIKQQKNQENGGSLIDAAVFYLAAKPEKSLDPILERLEKILSFRQDILSSVLLAASFYGMEELHMRLPRLEEILQNPFDTVDKMEAVSGTIMIADGGPAEGAKAMQLYMMFAARGIDVEDPAVIRMMGLLGILANRPAELASEILEEQKCQQMSETERFLYACGLWIENVLNSPERMEHLNLTAQNLLEGMPQEVAAIVGACLMDTRW